MGSQFSNASFEPLAADIRPPFDLSYIRYVDQARDPDYVDPQTAKTVTYTVDLSHKSVRWNISPFLNTSYSLNITRAICNGGGDRGGSPRKTSGARTTEGLRRVRYL